ncbi:MAG: GspH/FimT family pseudopilin [Gammaproteobacteria bacterium]|nr:GspH/FimT family pseudopilin [Gammaproteobacteria bacterium]MBU1623526.1 GspH/FimT family pseudopilin [Gammaproteobacteria bacterium]
MVELMVGIAVLAILAAVAVPSFQTWLLNSQVRNAAESISNGLQRARAEAVGRNTDIEFELSADSSWTVRVLGGADIETRSNSEGSKSVNVSFTPAGNTIVTFNGFGGIKTGTAPFTQVDVDSSVLPTSESQNLRITIGVGGNVRMCDPNATAGSSRACI